MISVLRQTSIMAGKDMRLFFKDRFAVAFAMLFPLLFVAGFSLALGDVGPSDEAYRPLVVTQEGPDGLSHEIIESLTAGDGAPFSTMPYEDAVTALEAGDTSGFVVFPPDFTEALTQGRQTALEVVTDPEAAQARAALLGVARAISGQLNAVAVASQAVVELRVREGRTPTPEDFAALEPDAPLLSFATEQVGTIEPVSATNFTLPGYLTMFVFFAAALSAEAIARERRTHTLERLMANGVRRESIVLGKYLGTVYRGLIQLLVLWAAGILIFNIALGVAPLAVIGISVLMVLVSAGFGVLLASMVRTEQSAASLAVLVSLVLAPIGGSWWPLFITPAWMQLLARFTPHGWANTAFNKLMLFGADGNDVLLEMGALAVFGIAFLALAFLRFRTAPGATA